jgi:hypothetical protein
LEETKLRCLAGNRLFYNQSIGLEWSLILWTNKTTLAYLRCLWLPNRTNSVYLVCHYFSYWID